MNILLAAGARPGSPSAALPSRAESRLEPAAAPPPRAGEAARPLAGVDSAPTAAAAAPSAFIDILRLTAGTTADAPPTDVGLEGEGALPGDAAAAPLPLEAGAEPLPLEAGPLRGPDLEEEAESARAPDAPGLQPSPAFAPLAPAWTHDGTPRTPGPAVPAGVAAIERPTAPTGDKSSATVRIPDTDAATDAASLLQRARPALTKDAKPADAGARAPASPASGVASPATADAVTAAPPGRTEPASDAPVRLPNGAPAAWRQPLAEALGDRLQLQLGRGSERAVIRLDPPMMGSVEIVVRHEAGSVQVQLTATHGEVLRQLHAIADGLRQDLVGRHYGDVNVQVADGSRDAGGRQRQGSEHGRDSDDAPGHALAEDDGERQSPTFTLA